MASSFSKLTSDTDPREHRQQVVINVHAVKPHAFCPNQKFDVVMLFVTCHIHASANSSSADKAAEVISNHSIFTAYRTMRRCDFAKETVTLLCLIPVYHRSNVAGDTRNGHAEGNWVKKDQLLDRDTPFELVNGWRFLSIDADDPWRAQRFCQIHGCDTASAVARDSHGYCVDFLSADNVVPVSVI